VETVGETPTVIFFHIRKGILQRYEEKEERRKKERKKRGGLHQGGKK
jgi:hypothetical protein